MTNYQPMIAYIKEFSNHITEALAIGNQYAFKHAAKPIQNIVLAGLGGSGIGAEIVKNYTHRSAQLPIVLCKDYFLPGFVNEDTLVIACSYSGNTEETIYALNEAHEKKATIVCITSGGQIAEFAHQNNLDLLQIPSGMPPRGCLGLSMVQILFVLNHYGIINDAFKSELPKTVAFLDAQVPQIQAEAQAIVEKINGKMPIIYADEHIGGVATRWRQQFNENSKILGWERIIPEMNHNELVGWKDVNQDLAVFFLHTGRELDRVVKRFEINKNIVQHYTSTIIDVFAKGEQYWDKIMYLILLGDWISWYLAEARGVDAVEVKVIDYLKGALKN